MSTARKRCGAGSEETGWRPVEHKALGGRASLIVAETAGS